jgi:putative spermidine/putrescine transport system ATP-binding protein
MSVKAPELVGLGRDLELERVLKTFGTVIAVNSVDLHVAGGEFFTLLGPSGSGKTTLLRLVAGFEQATSGRIKLSGRDIAGMAPSQRDLGMVTQGYALFPHMTVTANVAYGLDQRRWERERRRKRVEEMLELVGLSGLGRRLPRQLSGGQQQRVALARALAFGPGVLLMDEPLGALDRELRMQMAGEIRRIHRELKTTVLYVTHDQEEALALSDRIGVMHGGRLLAVDSPRSLYERPTSLFVARFLARCNIVPATVLGTVAEKATVRVSGLSESIAVPMTVPFGGKSAFVGIPPHALSLTSPPGGESFVGIVKEVLFLGESVQVILAINGGVEVVARLPSADENRIDLGQTLHLFVDPEKTVLIRDEADKPAPSTADNPDANASAVLSPP